MLASSPYALERLRYELVAAIPQPGRESLVACVDSLEMFKVQLTDFKFMLPYDTWGTPRLQALVSSELSRVCVEPRRLAARSGALASVMGPALPLRPHDTMADVRARGFAY